jgi:Na+:H+ antiporter, NhaA family
LLTAIAIVDDLGAVLVIAFFYTSDISLQSLSFAALFLLILITANYIGVRNTIFYAVMGIGGLWLAILLSGVHATIAAVLAAFTIPTLKKIDAPLFLRKARLLANQMEKQMKEGSQNGQEDEMMESIDKFSSLTEDASPPLQRLEHGLSPFVSFVVLPLFAFANAGVTIDTDSFNIVSPVLLGVTLGLVFGKIIGVFLFTRIMVLFKISKLPKGVEWKHILGLGFLAGIGFTMSLFITELAFDNEDYMAQAKIGILSASLIAGLFGYFYLKLIKARKTISSESLSTVEV